ncbi:MAG: dependent protein [Acidobacteriota bacterium]|jgi:pyridoxal phosphate enzyme (YggS family)|nr:dependent protein [Acidobacteriota bacterium]
MLETAPGSDELRERLAGVRRRIEDCARRAGRAPGEVKLIAVSKTHPPDALRRAIQAGVNDLGENRVQEADEKISELGRDAARWHLIGHLQANKARRAVALFDLIHTLDSASLAQRLDRLCEEVERQELPVLVQVDLGGEAAKSGVSEEELPELVKAIGACTHLRLTGLMTLPPFFDDAELVRPYFRRLRELRDELRGRAAFGNGGQGELSMGMSQDYEVAIEEGATFVRIGTAIFGERRARN